MKIVIPNFPDSDSFVDNIAFTLKAMGHDVIMPTNKLGRSRHKAFNFAREFWYKVFPQNWTSAEKWVVATARQNIPDLILCLTQSLRQEVLEELRKIGVKHLVAWWGDTPANMRGLGLLASGWDLIFIKDAAAVAKFKCVGLQAELLHEAMNPVWHKPAYTMIGKSVAVAGSYYGYRQYLVNCLLEKDVSMALYGPRPPRWASSALKENHTGLYITKHEKSHVFGSALACLNSTTLSEGNSLNCRAFEIAGAAGLQFIEDKPAVSQCFEPGTEVLTYRSVDEIVEYLEKAQKDPDWALKIREASHARANAHHTYEMRIDNILSQIGLMKGKSS